MTDGSVGIGRGFIFCEFRWLDQSRAWGICLILKMIGTFLKWSTVLKTCEFGLNWVVFGISDQFSSDSKFDVNQKSEKCFRNQQSMTEIIRVAERCARKNQTNLDSNSTQTSLKNVEKVGCA